MRLTANNGVLESLPHGHFGKTDKRFHEHELVLGNSVGSTTHSRSHSQWSN